MHTIETYEDYASLIKGKHFTLLMFTASWCGPCKIMKPLFKDYAEKCAKDFPEVHFSFVDVILMISFLLMYNFFNSNV